VSRGLRLLLSACIVIVPYATTRMPYLLGHPVPGVQGDTHTYFRPVTEMLDGRAPRFVVRTPAYPLFLSLVARVFGRITAVMALQIAVSLASQLFLVFSVESLRPALTLGAAVAVALAKASLVDFNADSSVMSDGLYASMLLVFAGFALRLFREPVRVGDALGASIAIAAAVLVRPAGLFLIGSWLMLIAFTVFRVGPRLRAALIVPLPAMLLALCLYNLATVGSFSISPWGTANILGATACYWQTSRAYPPRINASIEAMLRRLRPEERQTLSGSWNLAELSGVFEHHFNDMMQVGMQEDYEQAAQRRVFQRVAFDAIAAQPELYAKFVLSQFWLFNGQLSHSDWPHDWGRYDELIAKKAYPVVDPGTKRQLLKRYFQVPDMRELPDLAFDDPIGNWKDIHVRTPFAARILARVCPWIRNGFWVAAWALALVFGAWRLVKARFRDLAAQAFLTIGVLHLGAGVLVSLVEIGEARYSAPTEFSVYLSLALLPLLITRSTPES
jgi:hypothetical protein